MNTLWIGLSIFTVIFISFFIVMAITKGAFSCLKASDEGPVRSGWVSAQVYSGDDTLEHPDLKKISELRENDLVEGVESV